jgi:hypothetical protein
MAEHLAGHAARRRSTSVERRFGGSVLDVAGARRFARRTADWWGVAAAPVECAVGELARRAVCAPEPAFVVALTLDAGAVCVRVTSVAVPRVRTARFCPLSCSG